MDILLMILFLAFAVTHAFWFVKRRLRRNRYKPLTSSFPPKTSPPGMALYIIGEKNIGSRQLTATLLHFVRSGYVNLHRESPSSPVIRFEAVKTPDKSPSSLQFYEFLFFEIGSDGVLYVDDIYAYTKSETGQRRFLDRIDEWQEQVELELADEGLLDLSPWFRKVGVVTHFLMLVIMAILLFIVPWFGLLAFVMTVVSFSLFLLESNLTDRGADYRAKWLGYRTYLRTMTEIEDGGTDQWTAHFVYAAAFGLISSLSRTFPIREASELSLRTDQLPIYFYAAPGSAALSAESIQMFRDVDAAFHQGIDGDIAGLDQGVNDIGLSDS